MKHLITISIPILICVCLVGAITNTGQPLNFSGLSSNGLGSTLNGVSGTLGGFGSTLSGVNTTFNGITSGLGGLGGGLGGLSGIGGTLGSVGGTLGGASTTFNGVGSTLGGTSAVLSGGDSTIDGAGSTLGGLGMDLGGLVGSGGLSGTVGGVTGTLSGVNTTVNNVGTVLGSTGSLLGGIGSSQTGLSGIYGGISNLGDFGSTLAYTSGYTGTTAPYIGTGGYSSVTSYPSYGSVGTLTGTSSGYGQSGNYGSLIGTYNGYQNGLSSYPTNVGVSSVGYGNYTFYPGAYGSYSYGYPNNLNNLNGLNSQLYSTVSGYNNLYPQVGSVFGVRKRNLTPGVTKKPTVNRLATAASYSEPVFSTECPTKLSDYSCPKSLSLTKGQLAAKICEYDAVFTGLARTSLSRPHPVLGRKASDRCSAIQIVERANMDNGEARTAAQEPLAIIVGKECQLDKISKNDQVYVFVKGSIPSGTNFAVIDGANMDLMSAQSISKEDIASLLERCQKSSPFSSA